MNLRGVYGAATDLSHTPELASAQTDGGMIEAQTALPAVSEELHEQLMIHETDQKCPEHGSAG